MFLEEREVKFVNEMIKTCRGLQKMVFVVRYCGYLDSNRWMGYLKTEFDHLAKTGSILAIFVNICAAKLRSSINMTNRSIHLKFVDLSSRRGHTNTALCLLLQSEQ